MFINIAIWYHGQVTNRFDSLMQVCEQKQLKILVFCSTESDRKHIIQKKHQCIIDVIDVSKIYIEPNKETDIYGRARVNELRFGFKYIDAIKADRHFGRAYVRGAWYPRSRRRRGHSFEEAVKVINNAVELFSGIFNKYKVEYLILEVASLHTKVAAIIARGFATQLKILHSSRIENYYFFAEDEFITKKKFEVEFSARKNSTDMENIKKHIYSSSLSTYLSAKNEISSYLSYESATYTLKQCIRQLLVYAYRKFKNLDKYSSYVLHEKILAIIRYHYGIKLEKKVKTRLQLGEVEKYIFFPLQLEPESSMMVMADEYDDQFSLIRLISSVLPSGVSLVVKEHPLALGVRPIGFFSKILALPNVFLADTFSAADTWAAESLAVATINSSVGYSSALLGKPVLSFSSHNYINILPHVFFIANRNGISKIIDKIADGAIGVNPQSMSDGAILKDIIIENSFILWSKGWSSTESCSNDSHAIIDNVFV